MPRRLPQRWQPDSIREFWAAADQRYSDALSLSAQGRRAGAIYLWGYCAEMMVKAAYFAVLGFGDTRILAMNPDIQGAIQRGRAVFGIAWPNQGAGHNVRAWAELLVAERAALPGGAYAPPFDREVQACGQRIGGLWAETLRYRKNVAYPYEVRQMRASIDWLRANANHL